MNISALDEKGSPVDFWFLYKVPQQTQDMGGGKTDTATGYEYLYYDQKTGKAQMSPYDLGQDQGKGSLHLTLDSIFKNPGTGTGWVLYNDEMPQDAGGADNSKWGHTKGVIAFDLDTNSAIWLVHSWPKYVDTAATSMPTPIYGQTFLCLSLDVKTANDIARQMATNQQPQFYMPRIPGKMDKSSPLYALTLPLSPSIPGGSSVLDGQTRGGLKFKVIAKNREWGDDFWNDLVGPKLGDDMDVETWIRGQIPSTQDNDGVHRIYDIKYIDLRPLGGEWFWSETKDHAKWGITKNANGNSPWICVGDINRMITQESRGGGTVAFQDSALWKALKQTDFLVPPPGFTVQQAKALIQTTHAKKSTPAGAK